MNETTSPTLLHAVGVTKRYGDVLALAGVDVSIRAGEAVAVMGASGSGKTTLLHCLAAVISPDSGSIRMTRPNGAIVELVGMDEDARSAVRRSSIGFVFQDHLLLPELTAVENAALPLIMAGTPRVDAERRAAKWLAHLGLDGMQDRRIGQLSGGQAQRVAIARAQVNGAPMVFADEPTGALDSATSTDVMTALLQSTARQNRGLVVVTHDADVARRCDRVLHMRDGRLVGESTAAQQSAEARSAR